MVLSYLFKVSPIWANQNLFGRLPIQSYCARVSLLEGTYYVDLEYGY